MEYHLRIDGRPFGMFFLTPIDAQKAANELLSKGRKIELIEHPSGQMIKVYDQPITKTPIAKRLRV